MKLNVCLCIAGGRKRRIYEVSPSFTSFINYLIPVLGVVISIIHMIALAEAFGKGAGYGIGLFFLGFIFLPLLAFGDAEYSGGG